MITTICAICRDKEDTIILYRERFDKRKITAKTFSARRIPDRMHYRFVKCRRCGLVFSNPIFPPEKIVTLYKESDFTYQKESVFLGQTYLSYLEKYVLPKKMKHTSLLEIGCGNGFFLEEVKKIGIDDVYGIEPGKASVDKAPSWLRKRITVDVLRPNLLKKESFDVICCFHTLDHIIDPNAFIRETHRLLKKGGKAFFIVHNTDGLSVKLFGERSPIFDIEHIYLFNPKSLKMIFSQNNFRENKIINIVNKYPIFYWIHLLPIPLAIKKSLLSLFQSTKIGNIPIRLGAGNIGIIARK